MALKSVRLPQQVLDVFIWNHPNVYYMFYMYVLHFFMAASSSAETVFHFFHWKSWEIIGKDENCRVCINLCVIFIFVFFYWLFFKYFYRNQKGITLDYQSHHLDNTNSSLSHFKIIEFNTGYCCYRLLFLIILFTALESEKYLLRHD